MLPFQELPTPPPPTATLPPPGGAVGDILATPVPAPALPPAPAPTVPLPDAGTLFSEVGAPPGSIAAPAGGADATNLVAIIALFIYLVFFAVMGYRRGAQRELIVLAVALGLSFILQQFSSTVVTLFDRFGKGVAFLTGQSIPEQSGLGVWAAANTPALLTLLWLVGIVITYLLTGSFVRKSKKDGWAVILGIFNGLVFASIFAPLLTSLVFPNVPIQGPVVQLPVLGFLGNVWQQLTSLVTRTWGAIEPVATNVFFLAIILLILLAALTLRTSAKPKS